MVLTDRRWISIIKDQMHKQLRKIERNAILITSDSRDSTHIRNIWLPGRTMSTVWGECRQFVDEMSIFQDRLG